MFYELAIYWYAYLDHAIYLYHKTLCNNPVCQIQVYLRIEKGCRDDLAVSRFASATPWELLGMLYFDGKKGNSEV